VRPRSGPRPLLIVDGDSLAHRAYHALPGIEGTDGRPIAAMLGFSNMLLQLLAQERPRAVLVGWDSLGHPTYRNREFPPYQAQRATFDEPLLEQLDRLPGLVEAFGFAYGKAPGYEADDFLAAGTRLETEAGGSAVVVTSDRDAFQLARENVSILMPKGGGRFERVGPPEVRERYGVRPEQVPDFVALRGDPSDNLPGAVGIGAKTAATLLRHYGTLEQLIERADELSPRQRDAVRDPRVPLFKRIATMDAEAPVTLPADAELDWHGAADHAAEIGAQRLSERIREIAGAT
jgi:DNA polymerase I